MDRLEEFARVERREDVPAVLGIEGPAMLGDDNRPLTG
jgi:hypothetical protein